MKIKIDKGIDIPNSTLKKSKFDIPFHEMEIGDSFFIEADTSNKKNVIGISTVIRRQFIRYCRSINWEMTNVKKLKMRTVENGVRFWLIEVID